MTRIASLMINTYVETRELDDSHCERSGLLSIERDVADCMAIWYDHKSLAFRDHDDPARVMWVQSFGYSQTRRYALSTELRRKAIAAGWMRTGETREITGRTFEQYTRE